MLVDETQHWDNYNGSYHVYSQIDPMNESPKQPGRFAAVATGALHVSAVAILAMGSLVFFASEASWQVISWAWERGALADAVLFELGLHVGLCTLIWAALALCFGRLRRLARGSDDDGCPRIQLASAKAKGTVLTETLIVLPVALLLIMGIGQLALMNIATTLSDLAVIQAARSVWVWAPEAQEGRFGVDRSLVTEKARVQAAAIMAPTASSNFGNFDTGHHPEYAGTFRQTMGALYGAQVEHFGNDIGSFATTEAEMKLSDGEVANPKNMAFNLAFDSDSFEERTARKFFNAWVQTDIEIVETQEWIGAKMKYQHLCLMPLVAGIFGEYKNVNGQEGYYVEINRAYSLPKQVKPNARLPRR